MYMMINHKEYLLKKKKNKVKKLKVEDLKKEYDKLQLKYGAKELYIMEDVKKILIYVSFL